MKILYLSDSYPPIISGLSSVVEHLAVNMASTGHEVEVITLDSSWRLPRIEKKDGVLIRRIPGVSPGRSYHFPFPEILQILKENFDVLHVHNFHSVFPLIGSLSLGGSKQLFVVTPHYHIPGHHAHSKIAWMVYKPLLQRAIKRFNVVHCVSNFEAKQVEHDFPVKPVVIENGVDENVYDYKWIGYNNGVFTITCVARLERYKRVEWVIKAASKISGKGFKVRVNVVGSGPQAPFISHLAERLGVKLNIQRYLPREALLKLLSESNCVVNPSMYEAFSIVCAEALAMGVPVVVVRPWGINFGRYPRAIIANPNIRSIAEGMLNCLNAYSKEVMRVPTWAEVTRRMCNEIYT